MIFSSIDGPASAFTPAHKEEIRYCAVTNSGSEKAGFSVYAILFPHDTTNAGFPLSEV